MPIDSTGIESQIDSNLPDNTSRLNGASVIRFILKIAVRWVRDAINNNLSTWLRTSDSQPGGANADSVYRTGSADFRGGLLAAARTPNNNTLAQLNFGDTYPLQLRGLNNGPAFMEFHQPGVRIDQLGVDIDGKLKLHPWTTTSAYAVVIDMLTATFALAATIGNRKFILYDTNNNDHQFYGFGVNGGVLRYQIPDAQSSHIFYAGASAASSVELMRILGNGRVGIGHSAPDYPFEVKAANPLTGILAQLTNSTTGGNGALLRFQLNGYGLWDIGIAANTGVLVFNGFSGSGMVERMRIVQAGRLLLGQIADNGIDLLQVNGSISGKFNTASSNPSSGDIPAGYSRLQKNTSNGEVRLWVNDGGTMKSTLLS